MPQLLNYNYYCSTMWQNISYKMEKVVKINILSDFNYSPVNY